LYAVKYILIFNLQRFFEKIVWRFATFPDTSDASESMEKNISTFLKKMYYLFKKIKEEEADEETAFKSYYLTSELEEWTPDQQLLDAVLNIDLLQTIEEFANIYGDCASMLTLDDPHWPVQHDHVPSTTMSTCGKYDVNLIFPRDEKK
jgi:hypothetical protein